MCTIILLQLNKIVFHIKHNYDSVIDKQVLANNITHIIKFGKLFIF